jgi:hypothetical protein
MVLAGCGQPAAADRPAEAAPADSGATQLPAGAPAAASAVQAGAYRMDGARSGDLTLTQSGDVWTIRLKGGAPADMGAATPADCELQAQGALNRDRIEGVVTPFEGDIASVTAQDLQGHDYAVTVTVVGDTARVSTNYDGCGMGADLNGDYRRAAGG